jgi:hypothetical protein
MENVLICFFAYLFVTSSGSRNEHHQVKEMQGEEIWEI